VDSGVGVEAIGRSSLVEFSSVISSVAYIRFVWERQVVIGAATVGALPLYTRRTPNYRRG